MASTKSFRLRPVLKTEKELEEEKKLYFELPRKNCEQISPAVKRLETAQKADNHHRWHVLKRIMKRGRVHGIDANVVSFLSSLDESDRVVPHGEVSKRIYFEIFGNRSFDLYGGMVRKAIHPPRKYQELRYLASQMGIEFTEAMDDSFLPAQTEPTEDEIIARRRALIPKLTTEKWKIGHPDVYNPPVGFAGNPKEPFHSLGNEVFLSYDGLWRSGKMHGRGIYLFEDGKTYEGDFVENRPEGNGRAEFTDGRTYEGDWKDGRFHGRGTYTMQEGLKFEGEFVLGNRHGQGRLQYPSGLVYEGEFFNGKPHGRGTMQSSLTGWGYEGTFDEGFISGPGTIITPPPDSKRVIYYYSENREKVSLPGLVRIFMEEQKEEQTRMERKRNEVLAPLRGAQLRDYVNSIRSTLYNERLREKKEKYNETVLKAKEHKAKLYEARLKALAGDDESEAEK